MPQTICYSGAALVALIVVSRYPSVDSAIDAFELWEKDQRRRQIGTCAIGFDGQLWTVLASQDLIDASLPF